MSLLLPKKSYVITLYYGQYYKMEQWKRHFKRGKDNLSKHSPHTALKEFQTALESCPTTLHSHCAKIMFYIGITLKKLGVPNGAVKSWIVAQKLNKTGYSAKMVKRFVNEYGMTKQNTPYEDDWKAFHAIQLSKYLAEKDRGSMDGDREREMITEIIWDAWNDLYEKNTFHSFKTEEKLTYFKTVNIFHASKDECIPVDFTAKERLSPSRRCFCGSGLPYGKCCGRTQGEDELYTG